MMKGSKRDTPIRFQRATVARGALGTKGATAWADMGSARLASVLYGTGAERREAGVEGAVQAATFRVLADSLTRTVTAEDRIVHAGLTWDITGAVPVGRDEIEFTGTSSRG